MKPSRLTFACLLVLTAASAALAQANDVQFEIHGKDKVLGTIRPAFEEEHLRCNLAAGTVLKASAKSTQKIGPIPTLRVLFNGDPTPAVTTAKGRGVTLTPFTVPVTGVYDVVIGGDGIKDGDYSAQVSWAPQKKFGGTSAGAGQIHFPFSAPAHSLVSIALSAAPGSSFLPGLVDIRDSKAAVVATFPGGGKASRVALPATDDYVVNFDNVGGAGEWKITVTVTAPRLKTQTSDIRDSTLSGAFSGGPLVVGAVIDPVNGGSLSVEGTFSPLDGAAVNVPAGAFGSPTSLFIAQATVFPLNDGVHPAGPAVEFGPSGTQFPEGKLAQVTIPFDLNSFPGGADALVVYVKDKNGKIAAVPKPYSFGTGTVTFATSHFSTFLSTSTGPRSVPADSFQLFEIMGTPTSSLGGFVGVGTGSISFDGNSYNLFEDMAGITFSQGFVGQQVPPSAQADFRSRFEYGPLSVLGDTTLDLTSSQGGRLGFLRRGVRDDVMILQPEPGLTTGTMVLFKTSYVQPTGNMLAGTWNLLLWEFKAEPLDQVTQKVPLSAFAGTGTAVFDPAGTVAFTVSGVRRSTQFPSGEWDRMTVAAQTTTASFASQSEIGLQLRFPGDISSFGLTPVLGGDVLIGRILGQDGLTGVPGTATSLLVLVRRDAGAKAADFAGSYFDGEGGLDLHAPDGNPVVEHLGLQWMSEDATDRFLADRTVAHQSSRTLSGYDSTESRPSFATTFESSPPGTRYALSPTGVLTIADAAISGAVPPVGDFAAFVQRDDTTIGMAFLVRFTKSTILSK